MKENLVTNKRRKEKITKTVSRRKRKPPRVMPLKPSLQEKLHKKAKQKRKKRKFL